MSLKKMKSEAFSKFLKGLEIKETDLAVTIETKNSLVNLLSPLLAGSSLPISALTSATLPLVGDELLAIVQGGVTDQTTVSAISLATIQSLGFITIGVGPQYNYQSIHDAISTAHNNFWICTDLTETIQSDFAGIKTFVISPGLTLTFNNARQFVAQAGQNAAITLNCLGYCSIIYYQTSSVPFIDLTGALPSPPSSLIGTFIVSNGSLSSNATPFINSNISTGIGLFNIFGSLVYIPNDNIGSYCDMDHVCIDNFVSIFQTANPSSALKTKGGSINNLVNGSDTNASSVVFDLTGTAISHFQSEAVSEAGIYNFTDCNIGNYHFEGSVGVMNITYTGDYLSTSPALTTPTINFLNGDGYNTNQDSVWDALKIRTKEVDPTPTNAQQLVYLSSSDKFENKAAVFGDGVHVTPIVVSSTGSFVDFQSFTLAADLITDNQTVSYESFGSYDNDVQINCVFGSTVVFNVEIGGPLSGSGTQTYKLDWGITRISSTQANSTLVITGGTGLNAFSHTESTIISLINWTVANTVKAQGQCDIAINTISSTQAKMYIK